VSRTLAIAELRFKLLVRKMRGAGGALNLVGGILLSVLGLVFAAGLAVGFGVMTHVFVTGGDSRKLLIGFSIVFYVCFVLGVILPLLRGAMDQGFDASPFVIFPVGRWRLYVITVAACFGATDHLLYFPMLAAVALTGVLLPGVNAVVGLALIVLCVLFFVVWGNALALFLVSVMRTRRVREIAGIVALMLIISASFSTMLLDTDGLAKVQLPELTTALNAVMVMVKLLPPSIAAEGMTVLHEANGAARAGTSVLWLLVWNAAGVWIGYHIFDRYHLAERGVQVAARVKRRGAIAKALGRLLTLDGGPFSALPSEVRAVAAKDLHYLFRSVLGRFNLFMMPVFVFVMAFIIGRVLDEPVFGIDPEPLLLFGLLLYTVLFSNNFINNSLAWEGDGVKSYFLGPVSLRSILLGKNVAVWLYNGLLFSLVMLSWMAVKGPPGPVTLVSALFMFAAAVVIFTGVGNILSVLFPVARDARGTCCPFRRRNRCLSAESETGGPPARKPARADHRHSEDGPLTRAWRAQRGRTSPSPNTLSALPLTPGLV
jgi:ABC-2 type transport system permease protein